MDNFEPSPNYGNDAITMEGVKGLLAAKTPEELRSIAGRWPEPFQPLSERGRDSQGMINLLAAAAEAARNEAIAAGTPKEYLDALGISGSESREQEKLESWEAVAALGRLAVQCAGIARGEGPIPEPVNTTGKNNRIVVFSEDLIKTSLSPNGESKAQTDIWLKSFAFSNYVRGLIDRWGEADQQGVSFQHAKSGRRAKDAESQYLHIRITFQAFPASRQGQREHYQAIANAIFSLFLQDVRTISTGNVHEQRVFDTPVAKFFWLILDNMREGYTGICERCGRPFITEKKVRARKRMYCSEKCKQAIANKNRAERNKAKRTGNTAQAQRDLQ